MKRRNRSLAPLTALLAATALLATGCGATGHPPRAHAKPGASTHGEPGGRAVPGGSAGKAAPGPQGRSEPLLRLPGLGPATLREVPADTRQALVVTGAGRDENRGTAVLYERERPGGAWQHGPAWPVHNAVRGWTDRHVQGDLRSPVGVFTLTDAGGLLPDPGTRLPYDRGPEFTAPGTGVEGEPLAGAFDYVIAINYNRTPGTTPLDWTRPLGESRGGGIWLHVDHDGPTQGCVSFTRPVMKHLLRTLDPAKKPVVVMGDRASLRR